MRPEAARADAVRRARESERRNDRRPEESVRRRSLRHSASFARRFGAESLQRALDGGDVARAVVDQGDFHSSPFVLGSTLRKRLSRETAKRSARANALNRAST